MDPKRHLTLLLPLLLVGAAAAQTVDVDALVSARDCRSLLVQDGVVYGGLVDGGVLVWSEDAPEDVDRWTTVDGLAGHIVRDMAWSGRALWVATEGTGLTRVEPGVGGPAFRAITNLGDDLHVSAVAAVLQGDNERVHFGLESGGVGIIAGGLPGNIATTENTPGLVSDAILALTFVGDDLWVGTDAGVSVLRDGLYSDAGAGLNGRAVRAFARADDGALLAATSSGVFRHDADAETWSRLGDLTRGLLDVAVHDGLVWALTGGSTAEERFHSWDGAAWTAHDAPQDRVYALGAGDALWCSGYLYPGADNLKARRAWYAQRAGEDWTLHSPDALVFSSVDGLSYAPDGTIWMGDHSAGGFAAWDGAALEQFYELAASAPDSVGLFNDDGGILDLSVAPDGTVWLLQFFSGGLIRYDPATGAVDHINSDNSPLVSNRLLRIVHHPDGAVLLLGDRDGVSVLVDPDRWRDPAAWIQLSTDGDALGGMEVQDAWVEDRDRIWFAVNPAGIVLWDPNGSAGAQDPLTWTDDSDDLFGAPITFVSGANFSFDSVTALEAAGDGTLWAAGGNGVVHLRPGPDATPGVGAQLLHYIREKTDASVTGLISGSIADLVRDRNGDVWVCHEVGLDRIRLRNGEVLVDPYVGQAAWIAYALDGTYATGALAGLPEGRVRKLTVSPDGRRVAAGTDGGAILLDIGPLDTSAGPLDPLFLYPNPLLPAEHAGLRLGGISAEVEWTQTALVGGADVSIYNTEGQLVWSREHVANDEVFWEGETLAGGPAASGSYLARIEFGGQIVVKALSVVR